MADSPTAIDLSRVPAPLAIESLDYEVLLAEAIPRFVEQWELERAANPALPVYDVETLETDPAVILLQAWSYLRLLDRARVNDAIKAVLAPLAKSTNLDNVVAGANIERLVLVAATDTAPALMESDASLLQRYLLSFDRPAAGSRDGYLYAARTAWPQIGDVRVNGWAIHGRRGDVDIIITGPGGRLPTESEANLVRAAVYADNVKPEAVAASIIAAVRVEYEVNLVVEIPAGPDAALIVEDAIARVRAAADARTIIGGEVPDRLLAGAAYGPNVIAVRDLAPVVIANNPYAVPVCTDITIAFEVRT